MMDKRTRQREYMREWRKTPAGQAWEKRMNDQKRIRHANDPEKYRRLRKAQKLKMLYGISIEQYEEMLQRQQNRCACCGREPGRTALHVDHDHATGQIRELLCVGCNRALGLLGESQERIAALSRYLARWSP